MPDCDMLIRNAKIMDGSGAEARHADVSILGDCILELGHLRDRTAAYTVDAAGLVLAPGFIDTHTHDDTSVIRTPQMLPKLSQGVTTVIVGNCGISAAPVRLTHGLPDPMNLLGEPDVFRYPSFSNYVEAIGAARPAVNVAALVGHTALRNNHMPSLGRPAQPAEIESMRAQLRESLSQGALGLSTGLAYRSAASAPADEILALTAILAEAGAIYTTHMRNESDAVLEAMDEAFGIADRSHVPVVVSHLKCAGVDNWGRSREVLDRLDSASRGREVACDCYPYSASSSTLDLRQVDERIKITITWSTPYPELAGQSLSQIAQEWAIDQLDAARRLQPAGAIYHCMSENDVRAILRHPKTMIGSDGLPNDPRPHPRLWGTFPRVLGTYCRDLKLFSLADAIHKMTGLPARRFGLRNRGFIREGFHADLVLFDPETIRDTATFDDPVRPAVGIKGVWVNGVLSYRKGTVCGPRAGRFLPRQSEAIEESSSSSHAKELKS
jgi:N-acyl-D-amino-acid deacylase